MVVKICRQVLHAVRPQVSEKRDQGLGIELPQCDRHLAEEMTVPMLAALQSRMGLLARRYIHQGAHEPQLAWLIAHDMGHDVEVLDRSVGHEQSMLEIETLLVRRGT